MRSVHDLAERIKRVPGFDAVADTFDTVAKRLRFVEWADKGQELLGHPAHPPLTDLPIGFWTSAWVLDNLGGRKAAPAAQLLLGLGILSAAPTVMIGLGDATYIKGRTRRVTVVHATANSLALTLAIASWVTGRGEHRAKAVLLNWLSAAAATVGGYLGGVLTFDPMQQEAPA